MNDQTFNVRNVDLTIPAVTTETPGYKSRNVVNNSHHMRHYHVRTLHRVMKGLMLNGETLVDGRQVTTASSALCWLLEQIEKKLPALPPSEPIEPIATPIAPNDEKISHGEKIENENSKNENSKTSELEI